MLNILLITPRGGKREEKKKRGREKNIEGLS